MKKNEITALVVFFLSMVGLMIMYKYGIPTQLMMILTIINLIAFISFLISRYKRIKAGQPDKHIYNGEKYGHKPAINQKKKISQKNKQGSNCCGCLFFLLPFLIVILVNWFTQSDFNIENLMTTLQNIINTINSN